MCPNNWSSLILCQHLLYTNLYSDHLVLWNAASGNYKIPPVTLHFKDEQVFCASTVFAAESRIKNKHFSSNSPFEPQETPLSLLIHFKTAELHAPDIFSLQPLQSHHCPLWWNFSDEAVQYPDMLPLPFCLCCSLYPAMGDQCCHVLHLAENTDVRPKIIQSFFGGPCPILEHCYSSGEYFQLFTFCWLSWQDPQLPVLLRQSRRRVLRDSSSFCPLPIIILGDI